MNRQRARKISFRSKVESEMEILDKQAGRLTRFFQEERHTAHIKGINEYSEDREVWKKYTKDRMKTVSVALVFCLHIGVDPPDPVPKPNPCAKLEGWIDPFSSNPQRALQAIAAAVQKSYERWQPRARYKVATDPTTEDVRKLCLSMRRNAKDERVLFHYNGHGVPRPTSNGEIWLFNKTYTQYIPLSLFDLQTWMECPSIYVWDCSSAETIINSFNRFADDQDREWMSQVLTQQEGNPPTVPGVGAPINPDQPRPIQYRKKPAYRDCIQLAACRVDEKLPTNPLLPADLFTSCLTTPIQTSLLWYLVRTGRRAQFPDNIIELIPGSLSDRRTVLGELNWIFTAITDTIAWNMLPKEVFQRLFRQDLLLASLFRSFILAEKIMGENGCHVVSNPDLPSTSDHPLWESWDYTLDQTLRYLYNLFVIPGQNFEYKTFGKELVAKDIIFANSNFFFLNDMVDISGIINTAMDHQHNWFFVEQLSAFEVWLEYCADKENKPPQQLPIVLQVLLSQAHRLRALELLARFLDLGQWAVVHALTVGVFPYVQKLLQSSARELRPWLAFIWAKILAVDPTCQAELFKENGDDQYGNGRYDARPRPLRYFYFIQILNDPDTTPHQKIVPAFILAMLFHNNYKVAQENLTNKGYVNLCTELLGDPAAKKCRLLKLWVLIGLGRLWADYDTARWQAVRLNAYSKVQHELDDPAPDVRAAACYALGCLIKNRSADNEHASFIDMQLCDILCEKCCLDGSVLVRIELCVALQWYIIDFEDRFAKLLTTICDKINVDMLNTEQGGEEEGFDVAATIVKPHPIRFMAKASAQSYQTLRTAESPKANGDKQFYFEEQKFQMTDLVAKPDEAFRNRALGQIRYLEGKSFLESMERVWLCMLRLALDASLNVCSMAKVMVLRIEGIVVKRLTRTNEKIANISMVDMASKVRQLEDTLPDDDCESVFSQENDDVSVELPSSHGGRASRDNHSDGGGVLFVVGSPATNNGLNSRTPETPLAPPPTRKISLPATLSSQRSRPDGRPLITKDEAMKLAKPGQFYTPKRNTRRPIHELQSKAAPKQVKVLQDAIITSEFVEWCSRIFVHPILDLIQGSADCEEEENDHGVLAQVIPTDWAVQTREGLGQIGDEDLQRFREGERCEYQLATCESPGVTAMAMSTLRKILYFTDGRRLSIMRFEGTTILPRKFPAYGGNPFCTDTMTEILVINDVSHEMVIAGSDAGIIRIWDPAFNVHSHEFTEDEPKLISSSPLLHDLLITPVEKTEKFNCLYSWSQNSGKITCGGNVKCVRIWSADHERVAQDLNIGTRWGAVTALDGEMDDSQLVAVGFRSGAIHVHDLRIPTRASRILRYEEQSQRVASVAVREHKVVTADVEGRINVFDPRLFQEPVNEIRSHGVESLSMMDVHKGGEILACSVRSYASNFEARMPETFKGKPHNEVRIYDIKGKNVGSITTSMIGRSSQSRILSMTWHKMRSLLAVSDDHSVSLFSRKNAPI